MNDAQLKAKPDNPKRILFIAEAVTLAHAARPIVLARALDPSRYDVWFACDDRYDAVLGELPFHRLSIRSITSERFLHALAQGAPVYDTETLRAYVRDDLALIGETNPALIVGDFRLSLAVSARIARTPYMAITNAYWSPYARQRFPLPGLPFVKHLGVPLSRLLFRLARPWAFAFHSRPLNRLRREYGLAPLGCDLRRVYTEADATLYADIPDMVPTFGLPESHHYLGPIIWSPPVAQPRWWSELPADRPLVYVTLGSSGRGDLLGLVLRALAPLPVCVLAATAGRARPSAVPSNAFLAEYLPGQAAAERAHVVICNGGSPTVQQALVAGKPVLGLADNMDQYLNMNAVSSTGAGILMRADCAATGTLRSAVQELLDLPTYTEAAGRMAQAMARYDAPCRFLGVIQGAFGGIGSPTDGIGE